MFAAERGYDLCVQFLLENGANVNQVASDSGETALFAAARNRQLWYTQMLLEAGADVNMKNIVGRTCLHNAAEKGHSEIMRILVNANEGVADGKNSRLIRPDALYEYNECGTILQKTISNDHVGADIDIRDQAGMTPLILAAQNGHDDCIKVLLDAGANVNMQVHGFTALHFATKAGYHCCIEVLLASGLNINDLFWYHRATPLILAVQSGNIESLDALLRAGANVNQWKLEGDSAFIIAIRQGKCKQVEMLIESEADVNQLDHKGIPALSVAIQYHNSLEMISYLLASGADVNKTNDLGLSPLICAMQLSSVTNLGNYCIILIATLLGAGAIINTQLILEENHSLCLEYFHSHADLHKTSADLLYAAGEGDEMYENLPDYLPDESEINLMDICGYVIRKHLLNLDLHTHLFVRVSKLGLPPSLEKYPVHGQTLDGDDNS